MKINRNSVKYDFCELGITQAELELNCSAADILKIRFAEISDCFELGDFLELYADDGTRLFCGTVRSSPAKIQSSVRCYEISAKNAWADMEELIYQQLWASADTASGESILTPMFRSKIVLGQNSEGEKIEASAQLADILSYAVQNGVKISFPTGFSDFPILQDEAKDISCADAVLKVLRWSPNTMATMNYDCTGYPILEIKDAVAFPEKCVELSGNAAANLKISPRADLQIPAVCVKYERHNTLGNFTWLTMEEDIYPLSATGNEPKAIVMSVELDGSKASCTEYEIKCETLRPETVQWWLDHVSALSDVTDLTVLEYRHTNADFTRELVYGTIPSSLNFKTETDYVSAKVSYTDSKGSIIEKTLGVHLKVTDAVTGIYPVWTESAIAEPKPEGLARHIYECCRRLPYEGSLELICSKPSELFAKSLDIQDENGRWSAIKTPVTRAVCDLGRNACTFYFGPPKHLYPSDIAELFRINRPRKQPTSGYSRNSGKVSASSVKVGGDTPSSNGAGGDSQYLRLFMDNTDKNASIDIDTRNMETNQKAELKKVYVSKNGQLATAYMLMTEPQLVS